MKKLSYIIGCLFLMLFVWVSCDNEDNRMQTTGYLELGVSKNVEVVTRGFDVKDQSLAVDICTGANDSVVKHFSDYNDMAGERVLLDVGTYKVKVTSNPSDKLEFEKPTFYGDKDKIVIKAGETTQTAIECFLTCVKVTSKFTKLFRINSHPVWRKSVMRRGAIWNMICKRHALVISNPVICWSI